jgi:transcriptional regulator with XRE-family HTH domain
MDCGARNWNFSAGMERFVEEVRKRAAEFDLTQAELARRSGVTERAFQHYLSGRSEPSLATLVRIASALGCTPNDLLGVGRQGKAPDVRTKLVTQIGAVCSGLDDANLRLALDLLKCIGSRQTRTLRE